MLYHIVIESHDGQMGKEVEIYQSKQTFATSQKAIDAAKHLLLTAGDVSRAQVEDGSSYVVWSSNGIIYGKVDAVIEFAL